MNKQETSTTQSSFTQASAISEVNVIQKLDYIVFDMIWYVIFF